MKLTKKAFKTWLQSKGDEKAGNPATACYCPIAQYLKETYFIYPQVVSEVMWVETEDGTGESILLPKWATNFIRSLDSGLGYRNNVSGNEALKYLK